MTKEDEPFVPVNAGRLARMQRAVALASEGAFASAAELLAPEVDDDFGAVEHTLRSFIIELKIAIEQTDAAIEELRSSKQELQGQLTTIERQRIAIRELSAPIIDVWDGVLTIPLVGVIEGARMVELTERLLARINQASVAWVIFDLTGIDFVDTEITSHLSKLAMAIRLMGVKCMLAGIGARVAQTFVMLDAPMGDLQVVGSLRDGLRFCLAEGR